MIHTVVCLMMMALVLMSQSTFAETQTSADTAKTPEALDFEITMIDGERAHLSQYHGKVIMLVNVASRCGLTKQYKELQALHDRYANQGLIVLGIPANNFGGQEPGTNQEIRQFCSTKFNVEFDMLAKVSVKGDDMIPLYTYLTSEDTNPKFAGPIPWNFTKFLIDREGKVVARFGPRVKPDAEQVIKTIEVELAKPEPEVLTEKAKAWRAKQADAKKSDE